MALSPGASLRQVLRVGCSRGDIACGVVPHKRCAIPIKAKEALFSCPGVALLGPDLSFTRWAYIARGRSSGKYVASLYCHLIGVQVGFVVPSRSSGWP